MDKSRFVSSSLSIIIVNLVVMIINFNYNIQLTKLIGAEGMGLFQMAMSVLMIALVISIGGIPTAVSKLVAQGNHEGNAHKINNILKVALFLVCTLAGILILLLFFLGETISLQMFKNINMITHIYLLAPAIILISLTSVLRSYYYGLDIIKIPNISQLLECSTQLLFILIMLYYFQNISPHYGAMIAIISISLGESANLLFLVLNKKKTGKKLSVNPHYKINRLKLFGKIISIGVPIGISNLLGMSSRFATTILIPRNLMSIGFSHTSATEVLGRIMGMAMPLISLPFMVTSAVGIIIVPNLAGEMASKNYHIVKEQILFAIKISLLFSIPLAGLYRVFPDSLGKLLYGDLELGKYIYIMSFNTIFLSLQNITSSVLHGLNRQVLVSRNKLTGVLIQISACFLIVNPKIGINGFFIGFYLSSITVCILNLFTLKNMVKLKINYLDKILKPLFSSALAIFCMRFFLNFKLGMVHKPIFFIGSLLGGGIYLISLYILRAI